MSPQVPTLPEEILEEIFLRLPPDEPACLLRASLASKMWQGHLSGTRFRSLYCEFHGSPLMLGFVYHLSQFSNPKDEETLPLLVPTTKFGARTPNNWGHKKYHARDCRHGRVLLVDDNCYPKKFIVWNPMTGSHTELCPPTKKFLSYRVAVLCAVTGCDHHGCHEGPFQVVFFATSMFVDGGSVAYVRVYLQETGEWSKQCYILDLGIEDAFVGTIPPVLIENTLYLMITDEDDDDPNIVILAYNLASNCLSQIDVPLWGVSVTDMLMGMEDGSLGYVHLDKVNLYIWSRKMGADGVATWTQYKVLQIECPIKKIRLVGYMERNDIIFVTTELGIYKINIKTLHCKKLWKKEKIRSLIPYLSFYSPQGKSVLTE